MAAVLFAVVVAVSATIFGIGFAPEAHHEEAAVEHEEGEGEAEGATAGAIVSSILISLAGVALVPLALMPARRRRLGVELASLLSIGAAIVHFAVVAQHFDEWWLTGMFFLSIALFQLGWGLLVLLIRPSGLVYVVGATVNALIVVTWIVSRTTGVPVGPEAGEAEAVGFPDALSTAFEVVLVIILVALLVEGSAQRPARHRARAAVGWGAAAAVASLTALALVILA